MLVGSMEDPFAVDAATLESELATSQAAATAASKRVLTGSMPAPKGMKYRGPLPPSPSSSSPLSSPQPSQAPTLKLASLLPTPPPSLSKPSRGLEPFPDTPESSQPANLSLLANPRIGVSSELELELDSTTPCHRNQPRRVKSAASSEKSHSTRPPFKQQAKSDPLPRTVKKPETIDEDIHQQLSKPTPDKRNAEPSLVYVMPVSINGIDAVKIGCTKKLEGRLKTIVSECGATIQFKSEKIPETSTGHTRLEMYSAQVEQLAQKELGNSLHKFKCSCKSKSKIGEPTDHKEYFTVPYQVGREVVERWAKFCEVQQPYTKDWKLKEEWSFHLEKFRVKDCGRSKEEPEVGDDHAQRGRRWELFINSESGEWLRHRRGLLWEQTGENFASFVLLRFFVLLCWASWKQLIILTAAFLIDRGPLTQLFVNWVVLLKDSAVEYLRRRRVVVEMPISANRQAGEKAGVYGGYHTKVSQCEAPTEESASQVAEQKGGEHIKKEKGDVKTKERGEEWEEEYEDAETTL